MKVKTLSALAGVGTALILSGTANAAFTGLTFTGADHAVAAGDPGAGAFGGTSITTWQIWANFDNAADTLTAVFGNANSPMTVATTSAGGFFNNSLGGNNAPNPALFAITPSLAWDTYSTIGVEPGGSPDATQSSPGFPAVFPIGITANTNIGWFTGGPTPQGVAGPDNRVLIMQLSVAAGQHVSGNVGIQYRPAGATADVQANNASFNTIPAPGAIALLGLAGLVGSRRRRA